jgi:hypothetical protein
MKEHSSPNVSRLRYGGGSSGVEASERRAAGRGAATAADGKEEVMPELIFFMKEPDLETEYEKWASWFEGLKELQIILEGADKTDMLAS